ncbi:MAG: DUF4167 domain-containing protein [Dongiaceae bacterium]
MRQGPNNRRSRGRGPRRQHGGGNPRQQTFDSNGPDVRIRGNAYQVLEKYLAMARDAASAGDRIAAENYYQHAEHYYRIINLNGGDHGNNGRFRQGQRPDGQNPGAEGSADGAGGGEQPQQNDRRRDVVGPAEEPYDPAEDPAEA